MSEWYVSSSYLATDSCFVVGLASSEVKADSLVNESSMYMVTTGCHIHPWKIISGLMPQNPSFRKTNYTCADLIFWMCLTCMLGIGGSLYWKTRPLGIGASLYWKTRPHQRK